MSGKEFDLPSQGLHYQLKRQIGKTTLDRGISVGCGIGIKEMRLILDGVVQHFELFELSRERIQLGQDRAVQLGIQDRVRFHNRNAFEEAEPGSFNLVYWDMALHHMLDVDYAVGWSREVLREGGWFCMSDFVGPQRFQWSDVSLELAQRIRRQLPDRYLKDPYGSGRQISEKMSRPDPEALANEDPSEAADSDRILDSVKRHFPDAAVTMTGGVVYHLALKDILSNFDEEDPTDQTLLGMLLVIDELAVGRPEIDNHYATALASKILDRLQP